MVKGCKIAIVGSGPAGLACAYLLLRLGHKLTIFEQHRHPRFKACGGGLTSKSVALLKALGVYVDDIVLSRCHRVAIVTHVRTYVLHDDLPIITTIDRSSFDKRLLEYCIDQGAELVFDRVTRVEHSADRIIVHTRSSTYEFDVLIGADGAYSVTSSALSLRLDVRRQAIGYMTYARGYEHHDVAILDFTRASMGYAWIFPRGDDEANVGIGSARWGDYRDALRRYLIESGLRWSWMRGHAIPIGVRKRLAHRRVVLVGDAAGLVDPTTGEGIFQAMYSGIMAALSVHKSFSIREVSDTYSRLIEPLVKNLVIAKRVFSPMIYIVDLRVTSKLFRRSILGSSRPTLDIVGGTLWYRDALMRALDVRAHVRKMLGEDERRRVTL